MKTAKPDQQQARRTLLSGNQAIAYGAWEAGVHAGSGYPGTPSTEILECLGRFPEVDCEWSTNEKVALEVGVGVSMGGGRALVTMKHVGLNVAADPLFSIAYMGVNGGLVVVSADDPGMHSSQNEQDNRLLARAARLPLLEPATPQEAKDFTAAAFDLSEAFDTPVLLRTTTRISHGKGAVTLGKRLRVTPRPYRKNPLKYVVLPAHGRVHHRRIELERMPALEREAARWAQLIAGDDELAVITAGAAFLYVQEAFPRSSILKLGMTHPLPKEIIKQFVKGKKRVLVVEELEPFMEEQVRALGIPCEGKQRLPRYGELSVLLLKRAFLETAPVAAPVVLPALPPRPPTLCPGCMHLGVFYALKQLDAIVLGDIGCYTLGALRPLQAMDACLSMGASVGMVHGMEKVLNKEDRQRLVAVIGDSTFYHSGTTGLIDLLYNGGHSTVVILNNHTTAMTGHQDHPGSGKTLQRQSAKAVDLESLCRGMGLRHVRHADPYDLNALWRTLDEEMQRQEPSVIIVDATCVLQEKKRFAEPVSLDSQRCTECQACTQVGCPAIELKDGSLNINPILCIGCTHCQQVCADCNAGIDVPQVLELVNEKRYRKAFEVLVRANPFPAVAGWVCPHPCDHQVNALGWPQERLYAKRYPDLVRKFPVAGKPSKLSVRDVERFLGDYGIEHFSGAEFAPRVERPEKVAIVGSGPAGLSAAWQLRHKGFQVAVFESLEQPGGMMRYGIPAFRLDKQLLDAEINRLCMMGVDIRCAVTVGVDVAFEALEDVYDALVVAVGDSQPKTLDLEGSNGTDQGVFYGIEFLRRYNRGVPVELKKGNRVGVIGGGNTAIDCARVARRLGAEVTVYYRRSQREMPAIREEIEAATGEGIRFKHLISPTRLLSEGRRVCGLELIHMQLGPLDKSGRRRPLPMPGCQFKVKLDTVILAIGERADLQFLKDSQVKFNHRVAVNFSGATNKPNVFACGDVAFSHGTVTQGVATGNRVAHTVTQFLNGKEKVS